MANEGMTAEPEARLDARFSSPEATAVPWEQARAELERAEVFWITTVRADGRPHVTPLIAVWLDGALHFTTGPEEQKARNLEGSAHCILTTGCNRIDAGLDVVVEGDAVRVRDHDRLERLAAAYVEKYGEDWRFEVHEGAFRHFTPEGEHVAFVFAVAPAKALGFHKGEPFSQTSWRFPA
jgi:nitroimidazol reductase NimA-like FMN-containing flavoprotein (pyridoxamine 5'-phosphate oxidase superfamily)